MSDEEGSDSGGIRSYARNLTTRSQVNGYRFLLSRMDHAIVRRDIRMLHDPMRSQSRSLAVGLILGMLVLAGCGIWAYFSPNRLIKKGEDKFIYGHDSGARYVYVNGSLHPVLNAVSAWLILGQHTNAVAVKESELGKMPRGPMVGIVGAPDTIMPVPGGRSVWSVCDTTRVGLVASSPQEKPPRTTLAPDYPERSIKLSIIEGSLGYSSGMPDDQAFLATFHNKYYLVYGSGKRAEINLDPEGKDAQGVPNADQASANNAVMGAYNLKDFQLGQDASKQKHFPRQISEGLFNSLEAMPPLTPPKIPNLNQPPPPQFGVPGILVGSVVQTPPDENGKVQFYVIESSGYQEITAAMANLILFSTQQVTGNIKQVQRYELNRLKSTHELDVDWFPPVAPKILDPEQSSVICYNWSKSKSDHIAETRLISGNGLPVPSGGGGQPVQLASADGGETVDGNGDHHNTGVDEVYVQPGTGFFAQGIGNQPGSEKHGSVFYIADTGVRYGIQYLNEASALGLPTGASEDGSVGLPVPWGILSKLPQGPALSRADALVQLDSAQPAPSPAPLIIPDEGKKQ